MIDILTYAVSGITILTMTLSFFLLPSLTIKGKRLDTYWMVTLLGAVLLLFVGFADMERLTRVLSLFIRNDATNPFKIIVLFLSLTFISKFLDAVGLFDFLATRVGHIGKGNQYILFTVFYFLVSFLTMLTNNDIIIIVTPIVIYFARACHAKAMPYLMMVCFVLNTLSTTFLTTNVSNLYLGSFFGITYFDYLGKLTPVSLILMVLLYLILLLVFRKDLSEKIEVNVEKKPIKDRFLLVVGLIALGGTTLLLILSNVISIEMYLITLLFALFDLLVAIGYCFLKKKDRTYVTKPLKSLPYEFIPFLVSMFFLVSALNETPLLAMIGKLIANIASPVGRTFVYGLASAFGANLVNNVPMSLLFADILEASGTLFDGMGAIVQENLDSVYACILSSNVCALLTPCGALSSLMFMRICKENGETISYRTYLSYAPIGLLLLLSGLALIVLF